MRISDWSSDVCSSDLDLNGDLGTVERGSARIRHQSQAGSFADLGERCSCLFPDVVATDDIVRVLGGQLEVEVVEAVIRSEERRVGKECVSTCRSRWSR